MLKLIERNILKGTHFPISIKEIHTDYLARPYFKNIYLYLVQNKLPSNAPIRQVETEVENYLLFSSVLFRIQKFMMNRNQ